MTARASISQADLKRMATVAKSENVSVEMEVNGRKIRVIPVIQSQHEPGKVDETREIRL